VRTCCVDGALSRHLYKEEMFEKLLEESPAIAARRAQCQNMIKVRARVCVCVLL
jgi:hypothetical protein